MKKLTLTIAIVLGLTMTTFADGSLFQRDNNAENGKSGYILYEREDDLFAKVDPLRPVLPGHDLLDDQDADETSLGSGIVLLAGLGAAYLVGKKRREE